MQLCVHAIVFSGHIQCHTLWRTLGITCVPACMCAYCTHTPALNLPSGICDDTIAYCRCDPKLPGAAPLNGATAEQLGLRHITEMCFPKTVCVWCCWVCVRLCVCVCVSVCVCVCFCGCDSSRGRGGTSLGFWLPAKACTPGWGAHGANVCLFHPTQTPDNRTIGWGLVPFDNVYGPKVRICETLFGSGLSSTEHKLALALATW